MLKKITQYGSVGALGTVTNLSVFTLLSSMSVEPNISSLVAFLVAVSQNYRLNKLWTFKDHSSQTEKKFFKYIGLNSVSFLINIFILNLVIHKFGSTQGILIMGQASGIFVAMAFNFLGSYFFVFAKNKRLAL